jgi:hypothetical protein
VGGASDGGNGGDATAEADGTSYAYGGQTASPGSGGVATATSHSDFAWARGGLTTGTGDGGDGIAISNATTNLSQLRAHGIGGDTEFGIAGDGKATADGYARAVGGNASFIQQDTGSWGGAATADSVVGFAEAFGGWGHNTQLVRASSTSGDAYAQGGDGIANSAANGAPAYALAPNGNAEARGGNSLSLTPGLGGYAYADGSTVSPPFDDDLPTGPTGGHAQQP